MKELIELKDSKGLSGRAEGLRSIKGGTGIEANSISKCSPPLATSVQL